MKPAATTTRRRPAGRQRTRAQRQDDMGCAIVIGFGIVCAVLAGIGAAYRAAVHHPPAAAILGDGVVVLFGVIVGVCFANRSHTPVADPELARQAPPVCTHPNAVKVENLLNPDGEPWAWLCMECGPPEGTRLPADWKPLPASPRPIVNAGPAAPAGRWYWIWTGPCGAGLTGYADTEAKAKHVIDAGVAWHKRRGHRYEFEWKYLG